MQFRIHSLTLRTPFLLNFISPSWAPLGNSRYASLIQSRGHSLCATTSALSKEWRKIGQSKLSSTTKPHDASIDQSKLGYTMQDSRRVVRRVVEEYKDTGNLTSTNGVSSHMAFSRWMTLKDPIEKEALFKDIQEQLPLQSVYTMIVKHLANLSDPVAESKSPTIDRFQEILLATKGFTKDDLTEWARILSKDGGDQMLEEFFASPAKKPLFILARIIRQNILKVRNIHMVLAHVWDEILKCRVNLEDNEHKDISIPPDSSGSGQLPNINRGGQHDMHLLKIIPLLLYHSRKIYAAAMPSIASMVEPYMYLLLASKSCHPQKLDENTHKRLSQELNTVIRLLALPASIEPLKSMNHNWNAQKVLLELGEKFSPSLTLDERSYRAVTQVLAASKKSARESKVVTLRTRSWPPWRVQQDGIDAQSSLEDDLTRVSLAISRRNASGFSGSHPIDGVLQIIGGQEEDATPTIHTRKLVKARYRKDGAFKEMTATRQWAARVEATRDVQEAWGAFSEYKRQGGKPSLQMYMAMFVKLNYEEARISRKSKYGGVPGDGKEVLAPLDDNFSSSYKSHLRPPSLDSLYEEMMAAGIRPSGRCLTFLIEHASSVDQGLRFLRDSKVINLHTTAYLAGDTHTVPPAKAIQRVPHLIMSAFIKLLCRFTPCAVPVSGSRKEAHRKNFWIKEFMQKSFKFDPLPHALRLLKESHTTFRPAWYSFFRALAKPNIVLVPPFAGQPKNDILAWKVLKAALGDFHSRRLELDPHGFLIICQGFEKAFRASGRSEEDQEEFSNFYLAIKKEFVKLSEITDGSHNLPKLLHSIGGPHIHGYIRVLAMAEDFTEIFSVLQWMVENHEELDDIADQAQNGRRLIRRVLVAIRTFLPDGDLAVQACKLVESVESWNGWPSDDEMEFYIHGSSQSDEQGEDYAHAPSQNSNYANYMVKTTSFST
ncbi:hypothetical protein BGZ60DRAFT_87408 [Tricladium varicosporioides]|nr:hypothetical protein BGZ60DRAFT_87408 [Hymenoscyphus varicosporioides]